MLDKYMFTKAKAKPAGLLQKKPALLASVLQPLKESIVLMPGFG